MVMLSMTEAARVSNKDALAALGELPPFMQIMTSRLRGATGRDDWMETVMTPEVALFITSLRPSNSPGRAVLWAYTLLLMSVEAEEILTLRLLCENGFPDGFPSDAAFNEAWDAQKCRALGIYGDNGLDCQAVWEPLVAEFNKQYPAPCDAF